MYRKGAASQTQAHIAPMETKTLNRAILHSKFGSLSAETTHRLNLACSQIVTLEPETFTGLTQLNTLFLRNNKIAHIRAGTCLGLVNLKEIDFYNNQIEKVDSFG